MGKLRTLLFSLSCILFIFPGIQSTTAQRAASFEEISSKRPASLQDPFAKTDDQEIVYPGNWLNASGDVVYTLENDEGYVVGTNDFGDLAKGQVFRVDEPYVIHGAFYWVGRISGNEGVVHFRIWSFDGEPKEIIASVSIPVGDISASDDAGEAFYVALDQPLQVTSDYLIGFDMTDIGSSEIGLYSTYDGDGDGLDLAWEQWSDGGWHTLLSAWKLDIDLSIFPVVSMDDPGTDPDDPDPDDPDPDPGFAGGNGSLGDPFKVSTATHLSLIHEHMDAHFVQTTDIDLGSNKQKSGTNWLPIGSEARCFTGSYHGNGHTIHHLGFNETGKSHAGLFACLNNATIRDLSLNNTSLSGHTMVGGLAGSSVNSHIDGVHITGDIQGNTYTGGILGMMTGGSIKLSSFSGTLSGTMYAGGIAGFATSGATIDQSFTMGTISGESHVGGLVGLMGTLSDVDVFEPGTPASLTTARETKTVTSPLGEEVFVGLSDGTGARIPALEGAFEGTLERDDNDLSLDDLLQQGTPLALSGTKRMLRLTGTEDPDGLAPVISIPEVDAGSVNLETINAIRVGNALVNGELVKDHVSVLPVFIDQDGNLAFTDYLMREGLEVADEKTARAFVEKTGIKSDEKVWMGYAYYSLMTFQDELNWARMPRLERMIPDKDNEDGGYRRVATAEELTALAKKPICNIMILVHGHNEEEKEGSYDTSADAPWLFGYKQRVWNILYREFSAEDNNGKPVYPCDCTAVYEFIYPTYRPIFSPVPDRSHRRGWRHETLGEAFGRLVSEQIETNRQLEKMIEEDMRFNVVVVSHSQGGLVSRAGFHHFPEEIKKNIVRFVSWGSPHHGASLYTIRYALQSGHNMVIDGVNLPLGSISNTSIIGDKYRGKLNALALDAPGIRDLRWEASKKEMLNIRTLFPTITDQTEPQIAIPLFSENLSTFNQQTFNERSNLDRGGYTFLTGNTNKTATLEMADVTGGSWLHYRAQQVYKLAESTSIEQGAFLNELAMKSGYKQNDGAVPLYSQKAQGVFNHLPIFHVDMQNIDHEEFYGAEPAQQSPGTLYKAELTADRTLHEARMKQPERSCPTIEAEMQEQGDKMIIEGRLIFPLYLSQHGGDGKPGTRINRIEIRRGGTDYTVLSDFEFSHHDDGTFTGEGPAAQLSGGTFALVVILKDNSEVTDVIHSEQLQFKNVSITFGAPITLTNSGTINSLIWSSNKPSFLPGLSIEGDWELSWSDNHFIAEYAYSYRSEMTVEGWIYTIVNRKIYGTVSADHTMIESIHALETSVNSTGTYSSHQEIIANNLPLSQHVPGVVLMGDISGSAVQSRISKLIYRSEWQREEGSGELSIESVNWSAPSVKLHVGFLTPMW